MKHQQPERPAILTGGPTVYRHIAFPLDAFDYLKEFQRRYEARHGERINNNQVLALILDQHQRQNASRPALTDELREQAKAALSVALARVMDKFGQESERRRAILAATGNEALACVGAAWVAEMGRHAFPNGDPAKPDKLAALAVLECEILRRLHGETVAICEGLYRAMAVEPGWAAWSERRTEAGPLFFCAKAWAVSRFAGVDMSQLVHEAFAGFEPSTQLREAPARLTEGTL